MAHNFKLRVTLMDYAGEKSTKTYGLYGYLGVTIDLSWQAAFSDAMALMADLDNLTGAQIVAASLDAALEQDNILNTFKNTPAVGSDVTDLVKMTVYLVADDIVKTAPHVVPSPVIDIFLGETGESAHLVDITDPLLASYLENLTASVGGGPGISDGESVDQAQGSNGIRSAVWGSSKR